MIWLIYCAFFLVMLFSIFRMLGQQGKWAWGLFLGLIGSVAAYVGLFVLPLASASALQERRGLLGLLLAGGTLLYGAAMFFAIRKVASKMKSSTPPP